MLKVLVGYPNSTAAKLKQMKEVLVDFAVKQSQVHLHV